jgi:hypothetical protein
MNRKRCDGQDKEPRTRTILMKASEPFCFSNDLIVMDGFSILPLPKVTKFSFK